MGLENGVKAQDLWHGQQNCILQGIALQNGEL
jgi:hypothetical protein